MWRLKFEYSPSAANAWHALQDRFPNGHISKTSGAVYYAVTKSEEEDLAKGNLSVPGFKITKIAGYPRDSYFCCYDNVHESTLGLIFRIKPKRNLFVVEELYEGPEAPKEIVRSYAA